MREVQITHNPRSAILSHNDKLIQFSNLAKLYSNLYCLTNITGNLKNNSIALLLKEQAYE